MSIVAKASLQDENYAQFKYIHPPPREHKQKDVLDNTYSIDSIRKKFVVYSPTVLKERTDQKQNGYRVYDSCGLFVADLEKTPIEQKIFHEVIFDQEQKLKFDIDGNAEKVAAFEIPTCIDEFSTSEVVISKTEKDLTVKYKHIFETILLTVIDVFFITYGKELDNSNLVICESMDVDCKYVSTQKFSSHIIITKYKVSGYMHAKEFTRRVWDHLPERYRVFLDISVNKSIQNFRVAGCHKIDAPHRIKKITSKHDILDSIITNCNTCEMLQDIVYNDMPQKVVKVDKLSIDDINSVLEICRKNGIMKDNRFNFNKGTLFMFTRLRPSYCEFCKRTHDSDNTVMASIAITDIRGIESDTASRIISVFKQCRRFNVEAGKESITTAAPIGEFVAGSAPTETATVRAYGIPTLNWCDSAIVRAIKESSEGKSLFPIRTMFDDLPTNLKRIYSEPTLNQFELSHTLIVHAMMKMGKTKKLRQYIDTHFGNKLRPTVIRFVSFRQTFSGNIKEKFADFTLYSDVKGPLNQPRLIVQVESLYRLEINPGDEPPDLLILDECESIFEQFDSGLLRSFSECFSKFEYLLKYSKHIVLLDAGISDRTYRILKQIRPGFGIDNTSNNAITVPSTIYHANVYKNAREDKYWFTGDKIKWLGALYSCVNADEKIAIPMSSLIEAKTLYEDMMKRFPRKAIKLYSSETTMTEKKEHFSDVNKWWTEYDILIYTPTISAGVSFEIKHFHKVFGYFTDQSCPVETCTQMIGRIRDVRDHEFYICIAATGNNLPTDIDAIRQQVVNRRENLMKNFDETGLRTEYGQNGDIVLHTTNYFYMWLENMRVKNISKNQFVRRFVHIVGLTGATVQHLSDNIFEQMTGMSMIVDGKLNPELAEISLANAGVRVDIKARSAQAVASAKELDEAELEKIHEDLHAQKDISIDDRNALEKYRLRKDFGFNGEIDVKFVEKYQKSKVRRVYKNLLRITSVHVEPNFSDDANPNHSKKDPTTDNSKKDPIIVALQQIQNEERSNYVYNMKLGEPSQQADLNRKYVYDQHRYAIGLIRLCGWTGPFDHAFLHRVSIADNFRKSEGLYWEIIKSACNEFTIKSPSLQTVMANKANESQYVAMMIRPISQILKIMYGATIVSKRNDSAMYQITQCTLFTTDVGKADKMPFIPITK